MIEIRRDLFNSTNKHESLHNRQYPGTVQCTVYMTVMKSFYGLII